MKKTSGILKITSLLLVIIFAIGVLAGCGNSQNSQAANSSQPAGNTAQVSTSQAAETTASKYPLTLKDSQGTSVTVAAKPAKIISLPLGVCEMLMSIVDKSSIAAMTNYVDDVNLSNIAKEAKGVGQRLDTNAEKIIALQPDMVIVDSMFSKPAFIKQLRDAKLTVFVVNLPSNIDQEKELLKLLGDLTGERPKAEEIVAWMDSKLKEVNDKLANLKQDQKLSILDYSESSSSSGTGTNFDDIVTRAGLINPVAKAGLKGWPQLSKEMVINYNPDIISLPSWYYDAKNSFDSLSKSIKGDKALAGVKAVKNNKLIAIPFNHISATSQYSVLAVEDMAKAAYPELFK